MTTNQILTPRHPRWIEFCLKMQTIDPDRGHRYNTDHALEILNCMTGIDVTTTLADFVVRGGDSDLKIILNVILPSLVCLRDKHNKQHSPSTGSPNSSSGLSGPYLSSGQIETLTELRERMSAARRGLAIALSRHQQAVDVGLAFSNVPPDVQKMLKAKYDMIEFYGLVFDFLESCETILNEL